MAELLIYYSSSDARIHVATSTIDKLSDYTINNTSNELRRYASVQTGNILIKKNHALNIFNFSVSN